MMSVCWACLGPGPADSPDGPYHVACLVTLFGVPRLPRIHLGLADIPAVATVAAGKISISGAQRKALVRLSRRKTRLLPARKVSTYLLKPQLDTYSNVPENEHASMCAAKLVGLETPPLGLLQLADGSLAYLVKRYDRTDDTPPIKLAQDDFCQLAGRPASQRGAGTAEECAWLVGKYATDPATEKRRLFRHLLFAYWMGNGDLHLKNLSMLRGLDGSYRLAPVYDMVSTWVYRDRTMTMAVSGRDKDLRREHWLSFATEHAGIPLPEAEALLRRMLAQANEVLSLLERSLLPESMRKDYQRVMRKRARALGG
jgi:serine/threonine-protein kinase HipA